MKAAKMFTFQKLVSEGQPDSSISLERLEDFLIVRRPPFGAGNPRRQIAKLTRNKMHKATRRRTEITIETREIKTIRIAAAGSFCQRCKAQAPSFKPEEIALVLQISVSDVCRNIESDQFHLIGTERGTALICGNSLA